MGLEKFYIKVVEYILLFIIFAVMEKTKKILLVYPSFSTFVRRDYEILSKEYDVEKHEIVFADMSLMSIKLLIREIIFYLLSINRFYAVFIWFGDYHSILPVFFAKIFGRKSYVVIGGSDVASIPEIKYGSFSNPVRAFCTRWSFKWATMCLPVVEALDEKLKKLVPKARSKVVYTGYDSEKFKRVEGVVKENQILTVSITQTESRLKLKGLDRFVELAKVIPSYIFVIVGVDEQYESLFQDLPSNVKLIPPCNTEELIMYYSESKFYAQLSLSEGLPNAVCESMLCECVPFVTDVGGNKDAVGSNGYVGVWDLNQFKRFLLDEQSCIESKHARQYIINKYKTETRRQIILDII